jgi:hypothetical protein
LAAIGGIALLIVMFLPWFGPSGALERSFEEARQIQEQFGGPEVPIPDVEENAWEAFGLADYLLLLTALGGVALAVMWLFRAPPVSPLAAGALVTGLGIASTAYVLYRVVNPVADSARETGLFLGLGAAAGVALGGWLALRDAEASRDRRRRARAPLSPRSDRRDRGRPGRPSRSRSSSG